MLKSTFSIFCLIAAGCYNVNSSSIIKGPSTVDGLLRTVGSVVDDGAVVFDHLANDTLPEHGNKQISKPAKAKNNENDKTVVFLDDSAVKVVGTRVDSGSGHTRRVRRSTIGERVKKIIVEQLDANPGEVVPSANFIDDLGADSLGLVELILATEEEFNIDIPDEDAEKLITVQALVDYVQNH